MEPILGSIFAWPMNWAPYGFALCEGQILQIRQYTALFSLIGTTYGGNGTTTFALPDMRGAVPLGAGQGPGLSLYDLGEVGGDSTVALIQTEIPSHNHTANTITAPVTTVPQATLPNLNTGATASLGINNTSSATAVPGGANGVPGVAAGVFNMPSSNLAYATPNGSASINASISINPSQPLTMTQAATTLNGFVAPAGGSQPHQNMQPYVVVNYIIALQGTFPSFD